MADSSLTSAIDWLLAQQLPCGALPVSATDRRPYPEVTGYCLPTLIRAGRKDPAERGLRWLLDCQSDDGYWTGPDMATPYWFDTAVIAGHLLRLCLQFADHRDQCRRATARAVDWLRRDLRDVLPPVQTAYHDPGAPQEINLLGLALLGEIPEFSTGFSRWVADPATFSCAGKMQHFYCYLVEAVAWVDPITACYFAGRFARARGRDGSLFAYYRETQGARLAPAAPWQCYPAIAQWATLWGRLGYRQAAEQAVCFLAARQTANGGLTGGDGPYFPDQEITWATKYYVDACLTLLELPPQPMGAPG